MYIRALGLSSLETYKLLTGVVVPRPIAWITSVSREGVVNLAPFSQFTIVSYAPPIVGVSIGRKGLEQKDTLRNILWCKKFVVNIPSFAMMQQVHASSIEFAPDVSEAQELNVPLESIGEDGMQGVKGAPVRLQCDLYRTESYGNDGSVFVTGQVTGFDIVDGAIEDFRVDARVVDALARLGGPNYARMGQYTGLAPVGATRAEVTDSPSR